MLTELADDGRKLLSETGDVPQLKVVIRPDFTVWPAVELELALAGALLAYQGQTQAGAPLTTTSRHSDRSISGFWRPTEPASYGEWWVGMRWVHARRAIASKGSVGGITETSTMQLVGMRWKSPQMASNIFLRAEQGLMFQLEGEYWQSMRHRLDVDYLGVYDASALHGGARQQMSLRATAWLSGSAWRWSVGWSRSRQRASDSSELLRGKIPIGLVRQPRLKQDDLSLMLLRTF